ncbi:MAG: hypothetical protein R2855_03065 [Thermomicrobiales bacterium]
MLHRLSHALHIETDAAQNLLDARAALPVGDAIELGAEEQVFRQNIFLKKLASTLTRLI